MSLRTASVQRQTGETNVSVSLDLDGKGKGAIAFIDMSLISVSDRKLGARIRLKY